MFERTTLLLPVLGIAALTSAIVTPLVIAGAVRLGLYDRPDSGRHIHKQPVPRLGGVAIFIATSLGLLSATMTGRDGAEFASDERRLLIGVLLGGGMLFATGLVDDIRGIRPASKLAIQCVAAVAIYLLGVQIRVLGLGELDIPLGWLSLPVTVLWVIAVTNAVNLIDGLDGLATGIALVALSTVLAAALVLGNMQVAVAAMALFGALLGFLRYNFSPARIFLGDSGSLFVGFMLAVLTIYGSLKSASVVLAVVPLCALAIPLLEVLLSIARRWLRGVPILQGDARHIHHRLLAIGHTPRAASMMLSLVAGAVALWGLLLAFAPPPALQGIALAGGAGALLLLVLGLRRLNYPEFLEAGVELASGFFRIRRVIHDRICARELAQSIECAQTLTHLNTILQDSVGQFGFSGMAVDRAEVWAGGSFSATSRQAARTWKLDYPVAIGGAEDDDPYILRIWCESARSRRPFGAERVARIVAPSVESWLAREGRVIPPPELRVMPPSGARVMPPLGVYSSALGREVRHLVIVR